MRVNVSMFHNGKVKHTQVTVDSFTDAGMAAWKQIVFAGPTFGYPCILSMEVAN